MREQLALLRRSARVGGAGAQVTARWRRERAIRLGVQALLRAQMVQMARQYLPLGQLPLYERENLAELYKQYRNLGGNGAVASLVQRLLALPPPQ